jgi:putative transposase
MTKLKQPQINGICREMNSGQLSVWLVAKRAGVSPRWARELFKRYLQDGVPPRLKACGRPFEPLPAKVVETVLREHAELPCSALEMQERLRHRNIQASHNKIHAVLREHGLSKREPKKSSRRKWVRYERHKANSLWHADFTELGGKQLILFEDDATRFIVGYGLFDSATAENALQAFAVAASNYGAPRQLLTDNGTHFCNTHDNKDEKHAFHGAVKRAGVDHIFTRPAHPQCNGKLEKLNHTISKLWKYYDGDLAKAVQMYNERKLHMSLAWRTPRDAWNAKIAKGLKYTKAIKT